jgi:hypothetical protein
VIAKINLEYSKVSGTEATIFECEASAGAFT